MKSPVVSIIIPAYNYAHFIGETIASLQQQSFNDFECIVIDDGSTDNTKEVVSHLAAQDGRIRYSFQPNSGQPAARNAGLKIAIGQYIQFLDADDKLQSEKLRTQVHFMTLHKEISVVYSDVFYFREGHPEHYFINRWGRSDEEWMPRVGGRGLAVVRAFVSGNILELGCGLFRTESIVQTGTFTTALQGVEDYDYCFRMALGNHSFAYIKAPGSAVLMRHHPNSYSKSRLTMYRQEIKMRTALRDLVRSAFPELADSNERRIATRLRQLQDLLIDLRRKKQVSTYKTDILTWIWRVSSLHQKLYFFPRWVKTETEIFLRLL